MKRDLARLLVIASWTAAAVVWLFLIGTQLFLPTDSWLLDWHVYAAGANDLVQGDLYHTPLESPYRLPVEKFNYPPLSALVVLPLLPLPDTVGGAIWVILNVLAVAATCVLAALIIGARKPALWGGVAFLAYSIHPWLMLAFLGNNTPLVLLLVAAFAHEHLKGRDRAAGALLGIAIGLKLWPAALIPLLLREGRWKSIGTAGVVVGAVAVGSVAWLGLGVIWPAVDAMQVRADIEPGNPVFFISWLRETQEWWPAWGGYLVAAILAGIPTGGRLGIGLGILAGLAVVPNLWRTYAPTLVFAGLLTIKGLSEVWAKARTASSDAPGQQGPSTVPAEADSRR